VSVMSVKHKTTMSDVTLGNIFFPTSDAALQKLADEFKKISPAVPNVVAAVDSVVFETIAPQALAHDAKDPNANTTAIGSAFNRQLHCVGIR